MSAANSSTCGTTRPTRCQLVADVVRIAGARMLIRRGRPALLCETPGRLHDIESLGGGRLAVAGAVRAEPPGEHPQTAAHGSTVLARERLRIVFARRRWQLNVDIGRMR
jgi:hypothetical protein